MDRTIRPAKSADVPAIRRIAERGWRATYDEILSDDAIERALTEWYDPATVERQITDSDVVYLVAERETNGGPADGDAAGSAVGGETTGDGETDGEATLTGDATDGGIVGYVGGGPATAETANLGAIYVDPDRWGAGIGSALLRAFERRWLDRGRTRLRIRVLAANDVAIPFYRAKGFEVVERHEETLFGEPVEELVFAGRIDRDD